MSEIKSKTMENVQRSMEDWYGDANWDTRSLPDLIKEQIRAAVAEFAEMADIEEVINYLEQSKQEGFISWANDIKQALAAFGVEEKW